MTIERYAQSDEAALFEMMESEGEEWKDYFGESGRNRYKAALESSIAYVAREKGILCGYCRCRDDGGFGIYVCDLLVRKNHRGRRLGHRLMAQVCADFPGEVVYVMSDVDGYYEKLGYRREGSVFQVIP